MEQLLNSDRPMGARVSFPGSIRGGGGGGVGGTRLGSLLNVYSTFAEIFTTRRKEVELI